MIRTLVPLLLLVAGPALAQERSSLEVQGKAPAGTERCLDHTVRELGMSAKQVPGERLWNVQPQFLHAGALVPDGTVQIRIEPGAQASTVIIRTTWNGGVKAKEHQAEIEQRMIAMASMMTVACGASPADKIACTLKPAGANARTCESAN